MRAGTAAGHGGTMKPTQALHEAGQSLWLDNITRALLDEGILPRYVAEYSVTGLTSNPTIFDRAIKDGTAYDADIAARKASGATDEQVFFDLALADLRQAALDNLFIKIPGTAEGLPAVEECIYAGVPVNVTLLFPAEQYRAAAEAYLRGVQRRIRAELDPAVGSVASLFVSRWARLANEGARAQRLLWASTSVKDPRARDVLYVEALAAPFTVNTMPDQTLEAFAASWQDLLARIGARREQLARTA
jgi:transaldolase